MSGRIDYQIEKYRFTEATESERLTKQWADVIAECQASGVGAEERLRIALLNVDYVTSFELPFRLLLTRAPQLIASVRDELALNQKSATFNGKRFGCVYSLKSDLTGVPEAFQYHLSTRIRRTDGRVTAKPLSRNRPAGETSTRTPAACAGKQAGGDGAGWVVLVWPATHRRRCTAAAQNGDADRHVGNGRF